MEYALTVAAGVTLNSFVGLSSLDAPIFHIGEYTSTELQYECSHTDTRQGLRPGHRRKAVRSEPVSLSHCTYKMQDCAQ